MFNFTIHSKKFRIMWCIPFTISILLIVLECHLHFNSKHTSNTQRVKYNFTSRVRTNLLPKMSKLRELDKDIIDNRTGQICPGKPTSGVSNRKGGNWVAIKNNTVIKYDKQYKNYKNEKFMAITLSPYNGFVDLYAYYDNCHIMVFELLKHGAKVNKTPLNRLYIHQQLTNIWQVFKKHDIFPSSEFFYGFCCNMWLTKDQRVIMYDFDAYTIEHNHSKIDMRLKILLRKLDNEYFNIS